jgi:hypothetical protein
MLPATKHDAGPAGKPDGVQQRSRSHDDDVEGVAGLEQAGPDDGLGGQMEDDLGLGSPQCLGHPVRVSNVCPYVIDEEGTDIGSVEVVGLAERIEGVPGDVGPQLMEPKRQPRPLEAGVAGDQHGASRQ